MALLVSVPDPEDTSNVSAYTWIGRLSLNFVSGEVTYERRRHRSAEAAAAGKPCLSSELITIPPQGIPAQYGPAPVITPEVLDGEGNVVTPAVYGDPPLIRPAVPGLTEILGSHAQAFGELRQAIYDIEKTDAANAGYTEV